MTAFHTGTLGFLLSTLGIAVCIWMAGLGFKWWELKTLRAALSKSVNLLLIDIAGISLFLVVVYPVFVVRTVYYLHAGSRYESSVDAERYQQVSADLKFHRHNIATTDPVFGNLIDLLSAFSIFRNSLHGESCVVRVTAPPQSLPMASAIAQLQIAASNCATFGPDALFDRNPDLLNETMKGIVPDAIVFHAAKDDTAANQLFSRLSNLIKLVRSYQLPASKDYQSPPSTTVVDIDRVGVAGSNQAGEIRVFCSGRRWPGVGEPDAS